MKLKLPTNLVAKLQTSSWWLKLAIGLIVGFIILLDLAVVFGRKKQPITPLPTPTPTVIPIEEITNPSSYATDEAVLKIEEGLKKIEFELQNVDLKEVGLNPPILDFDIKF